MSMRKQPRVECDIILNKFGKEGPNICLATDISLSGMRIARMLDPYLETQQKFQFQIELPGDEGDGEEPLLIGAKKIWEDAEGFGVRFTSISHSHFVRLRNWLQTEALVSTLPAFR